ncbi:hypothetical protein GCM10022407_17440 [Hymenobacter antarcticus]|uniref:Uncharacterized protein n=1 Tax=Hymenobacter antarcticus TaxID=486270 RepID=A0ABP7PYI2_9BACT
MAKVVSGGQKQLGASRKLVVRPIIFSAAAKDNTLMPKRPEGLLHVPDFLEPEPPQLIPNGYGQAAVLFHPDNVAALRAAVN